MTIRKCTEGFDISSALSCYNGTNAAEGVELLKAYGDVTNTIDLSFVPSIEINNVSFEAVLAISLGINKFNMLGLRMPKFNFKKIFKYSQSIRTFRTTTIGHCWRS